MTILFKDDVSVFRKNDVLFEGNIKDATPVDVTGISGKTYKILLKVTSPATYPFTIKVNFSGGDYTFTVSNANELNQISSESFDEPALSVEGGGNFSFDIILSHRTSSNEPIKEYLSLGTFKGSLQRQTGRLVMTTPGEDSHQVKWIHVEDTIEIKLRDLLEVGGQSYEVIEVSYVESAVTDIITFYECKVELREGRW
jgi:hypothetical protein